MRKTKSAGDEIVTMDRRSTKDRRTESKTKTAEKKRITEKKSTPSKPTPTKHAESIAVAPANRRNESDRRSRQAMPDNMAKLIAEEKRKVRVQRRRQIDPTTCERDYSGDEIAFMQAMDEYKRKNGRMFPTCSEILEVVRSIGYVKVSFDEPAPPVPSDD
jgi:hypothetical protein